MGKHKQLTMTAGILGVLAMGALVACDPAEEVLTEAAVRIAVDNLGTDRLQDEGFDVDGGLDCDTPDDNVKDKVSITCTGKTTDGKKIKISGSVSDESGDCVRGALTAVVGTRTIFDADFLGDCPKK